PHVLEALSTRAKTAGPGGILSTKLKILSQISLSDKKGIHGSRLKEIIGSISLPAIYQHLKELESKNLILRKKEGKNVFYSITEKGKKVLDALDILITLL
ncbi:MAG: winged helix-turn-helix transcriptional regulator, partial [Promethearchaeota archaeon]